MLVFALRRLAAALLVLWAIFTLTFLLMHAAPGGPFDRERPLPPEVRANLERVYGLDAPLHVQYGRMLASVLRLDFGVTYASAGQRTVAENIAASFPVSAELGLYALLFALLVGIPCGVLGAAHHNRWPDRVLTGFSLLGVGVPSIVLAPLLIVVFGVELRWLPVGGWEGWQARVLPTISLGLVYAAVIARLSRGGMLDVLNQDYIRAARARGLSEWQVLTRHALRGGLLPVVTYLGPALASLLTGSVVVERIFNIPGISVYFIDAAEARDYPMVVGVVLLYSALLVGLHLVVDLAYAWLDPRQRHAHAA